VSWIARSSNEKRSPSSVPGSFSDVVPTGTFLWNLSTSFWTRIALCRQLYLLEQQFQFYRDFSFTALLCSGIVRLGLLSNSLLPQVINGYFLLRIGPEWGIWPCLRRCMLWHSQCARIILGRILESLFLSCLRWWTNAVALIIGFCVLRIRDSFRASSYCNGVLYKNE